MYMGVVYMYMGVVYMYMGVVYMHMGVVYMHMGVVYMYMGVVYMDMKCKARNESEKVSVSDVPCANHTSTHRSKTKTQQRIV